MRLVLLSAAALLLPGFTAAAQGLPAAEFTLVGVVLDNDTGQPVSGVSVEIEELRRRVVTDPAGRFAFAKVSPGVYTFVATRLGYAEVAELADVGVGDELVVRLWPQPLVLEGLSVVADRFERRRRAVGVSSTVSDHEQLITSTAASLTEFLQDRHQVRPVPCPRGGAFDECLLIRGRAARVSVYVDDVPIPGGVFVLDSYRPDELYRVEVYRGLAQIRVYTQWFVEGAARGRRSIGPICVVC